MPQEAGSSGYLLQVTAGITDKQPKLVLRSIQREPDIRSEKTLIQTLLHRLSVENIGSKSRPAPTHYPQKKTTKGSDSDAWLTMMSLPPASHRFCLELLPSSRSSRSGPTGARLDGAWNMPMS